MATTSYGTPYVVSADLVSGYPGTSLSLADRVDDISFKGNGINNQTGTTYTLDILDAGKTVTLSNSSAVTVTIPTNTAEAIEIGSIVRFNNKGAGTVTIQPDGGVTLNGGNITLSQNAGIQLVKLDTNIWGQIESLGSMPGLNLVSPTSIANSGGSASASGGAVTFTGATSVSLNGVFTSTYENYRVMFYLTQGSGTQDIYSYLKLRASGSDSSASYYSTASGQTDTGSAFTNASSNVTNGFLIARLANTVDNRTFVSLDIHAPQLSARTSITGTGMWTSGVSSYTSVGVTIGGLHAAATAYDGFTITSSAALTGIARVYGYRN